MNATATVNKTVREIALENAVAIRVFENLGVDYCCGGHKSLGEACADSNVSLEYVMQQIEAAQAHADARATTTDWQTASLTELIAHINNTHHVFVRTEVPRIQQLAAKVASRHGENHPETQQVQQIFSDLAEELASHLMKEEQILFPYVVAMDRSQTTGEPLPDCCFGTVQNPVRVMFLEHDNAGNALRSLRQLTNNYTAPADACTTYHALYQALAGFEADLHQHIHLENNILFPRALALEAK